jgi:LysM repeat protein
MGLMSFLKDGGKNVLDKQIDALPDPEPLRASALMTYVKQLGLKYNNLTLKTNRDVVTLVGEVAQQEDSEKMALAIGNVKGVSAVNNQLVVVAPSPPATFHTVEKGDTLSLIAKAVYGDMMKYPIIFEANKPMLADPNEIEPGQVLRIPAL